MAAVKACGPGAVLSGFAAAHLLSLLKGRPPAPEVATRTERRVQGIRTRRRRNLHPRDRIIHLGIPVMTVPAALVDIAGRSNGEDLARYFHEARVIHRTTPRDVERALARRPNAPGAADLRAAIRGDTRLTLSALERAFLRLLKEHGLPLPQTNRIASGRYVDCRWPDLRVTVELDGYLAHDDRHAWEQDRRREREAYARGDQFRRYTYDDVTIESGAVVRELTALLVMS
jgi:very-short-patch-repair endonuclease